MKARIVCAALSAVAFVGVPASAMAGSRASDSKAKFAKFSQVASSHASDRDAPPGRAKPKNKFPPGLVDKCFGDSDHPGSRGHERACEGRSRGTG